MKSHERIQQIFSQFGMRLLRYILDVHHYGLTLFSDIFSFYNS